jgi:hypothetical protein
LARKAQCLAARPAANKPKWWNPEIIRNRPLRPVELLLTGWTAGTALDMTQFGGTDWHFS